MEPDNQSPGMLIARLDRIPIWSLPGLFIGIIGVGFLFTFYDIFDINVSFIQTCTQIVPHCTPPSAANYIGLPVLLNLVGYVIGTLILGPLADRAGRRDLLLVTMVITGIGSVITGVVNNYAWFIVARTITGVGIGADFAIVNTYINEMAPRQGRARYTALIFFFSALGAVLGIWLGLWLTTPATPLPLGLPFAVASPDFEYGWRVMYLIGGLLALVGVLLRFQLPELARWLIARGRLAAAVEVIETMERRASRRVSYRRFNALQSSASTTRSCHIPRSWAIRFIADASSCSSPCGLSLTSRFTPSGPASRRSWRRCIIRRRKQG